MLHAFFMCYIGLSERATSNNIINMFRFTFMRYALLVFAVTGLTGVPDVSAQFSGSGAGTKADPYKIYNPAQLNQVRNYTGKSDVYFTLGQDIDLTSWIASNSPEQGWNPIGTSSNPFCGTFMGNNHSIKGLSINRGATDYVGLFGVASGATVTDLTIEGSATGYNYVGLLAGQFSGTVKNCKSASATIKGAKNLGGLVGYFAGTAEDCSVKGTVTGTGNCVGGLIGTVTATATEVNKTISGCFASGTIEGRRNVGGLIGEIDLTGFVKISNRTSSSSYYCYYTTATACSGRYIISDCGSKSVINATSEVGGLIGLTQGGAYEYELKIK